MCMSPDMHSPGGGASHSTSTVPPYMSVTPLQNGMQGSPGAEAFADPLHTDTQQYIAYLREHEYPSFIHFHMSQGMSQQQAHSTYSGYESMKVSQRMQYVSGAP